MLVMFVKLIMRTILVFLSILLWNMQSSSQEEQNPKILCASDEAPYRDFDFVLGEWEFFNSDGKKIAEQTYRKQEMGCLILEKWTTVSGSTGTGMTFVDPNSGLWRQVWMSPAFHIDYSGGLDHTGAMVLEGTIYPNDGSKSSPVRGIWEKKDNNTLRQEFLKYDEKTKRWNSFFLGYAHPKKSTHD